MQGIFELCSMQTKSFSLICYGPSPMRTSLLQKTLFCTPKSILLACFLSELSWFRSVFKSGILFDHSLIVMLSLKHFVKGIFSVKICAAHTPASAPLDTPNKGALNTLYNLPGDPSTRIRTCFSYTGSGSCLPSRGSGYHFSDNLI